MKKIIIILGLLSSIILINNKEEKIIIPNESIRIRVIANSNTEHDQQIKNNIKDDIYSEINRLLKNTTTISEARKILKDNIKDIKVVVSSSLKQQKEDKTYTVNYGMNYFPEKEFKGIIYQEGMYESLVVTIGEGKGNNWWCVLYPPLCMIEENEEVEYKSYIKEIIDKYMNKQT